MIFSYRENQILGLLIDNPSGLSIDEISDLLSVSKRTIYREVSGMQPALAHMQLKLAPKKGGGYQLMGDRFFLDNLKSKLHTAGDDFDIKQRQSALICLLLLAKEEIKMEALAIDLGVSISTIQTDLQSIEEAFSGFNIEIIRKKSIGVIVNGRENERRQILSGVINGEVNEYDFFRILIEMDKEAVRNFSSFGKNRLGFFLDLIAPASLLSAYRLLLNKNNSWAKEVSDSHLQQMILLISISIDRMLSGNFVEESLADESLYQTSEFALSQRIINEIAEGFSILIPSAEEYFLAQQMRGMNFRMPQNFFMDTYDAALSYQVKELIRLVSGEISWDFRQDEQLFHDLVSHISSVIKRSAAPIPQLGNSLLDKIREKYEVLFAVLKEKLAETFPTISLFGDEATYILLHFAASMDKVQKKRAISVLVLCTSGIGTSKILENRIRKNIPEISEIFVSKVSNIANIKLKNYDLILSTIFLPGFLYEYKMITPLLLENEIEEIRSFIEENFAKSDKFGAATQPSGKRTETAAIAYEKIYEFVKFSNQVLEQFALKPVSLEASIYDTLLTICSSLSPHIVKNPASVSRAIIDRIEIAPMGMPGTNFALFHTSHKDVLEGFFAIYKLDEPIKTLAVDGSFIMMERILLMLGPDPLPSTLQNILGKISSSIIESDLNIRLYQNGSEEEVFLFLSGMFVEGIKNQDLE